MKELKFKPGRQVLTRPLILTEPTRIIGAGHGDAHDGSAGTILVNATGQAAIQVYADWCKLEGFALTAEPGAKGDGILIGKPDQPNGSSMVTIRDVMVQRQGGHGIVIRNGNCGTLDNVYLWHNGLNGGGHGLLMDSNHPKVDNVNSWRVSVQAIGNKLDGVHINVSAANRLDVNCEGNGGAGLYLNRPYQIVTGYLEGNGKSLVMGDSAFECEVTLRHVAGTQPEPTIINPKNRILIMDGSGRAF